VDIFMAGLDDLFAQIPVADIAQQIGADPGEVDSTIRTLVPVLVGGLHDNAQNADSATNIEAAATNHAAQGLLDSGAGADRVDPAEAQNAIAKIFGGNDTGQVASALSDAGAGNSELIQKLLPMLAPIVLAYIGKQLGQKGETSGGGLGDVLGSILGGASGGGNKSIGSVLGNVLGGKSGEAIGNVLGSLLGGKK
jgi:hypothetical protein